MAAKKKKRRRRRNNDRLVLRLLLLVVFVLVVFEGKLVRTMFSQHGVSSDITVVSNNEETLDQETITEVSNDLTDDINNGTATVGVTPTDVTGSGVLVGPDLTGSGSGDTNTDSSSTETVQTVESDLPASAKIVQAQDTAVDDSYFSDAVFIGDSRMAGFQNSSGITQGDFLAGVGMSIDQFSKAQVQTVSGTVTVYQGLSGKQYNKIYIMLGANDLGYYPWENFKPDVEQILEQIHKLQPNAIIYIISCIYVEEAKVTTSYVNNANVKTVNENLLQACEELGYCYFLNANEIFDNGYHALIQDASQDGVHLYEHYLKMLLDYLHTHYIPADQIPAIAASVPVTATAAPASAGTPASTDQTAASSAGSSGTTLVGGSSAGN